MYNDAPVGIPHLGHLLFWGRGTMSKSEMDSVSGRSFVAGVSVCRGGVPEVVFSQEVRRSRSIPPSIPSPI